MTAIEAMATIPTARAFLAEAKRLSAGASFHTSIDYIFDSLDELMIAGDFAAVDCILAAADPRDFGTTNVLAFLVITLSSRELLRERAGYVDRATAALRERGGNDDVVEWMRGLR